MGQVRDFLMPDLGEGLESGEIVQWNVEVGDHVELNEEICDIETAKAVVSVPCPFAGTVEERFGEVGEEIEVGTPLIRIDVEEVASGADVPDEVAEQLEGVEDTAGTAPEVAQVAGAEAGPQGGAEDAAAERKSDLDADEEPQPLVGYGQSGSATRRRRQRGKQATQPDVAGRSPDVPGRPPDVPGRPPGGNGQVTTGGDGQGEVTKPLAKPPVRKLAKDLGVDLRDVAPGSGDGGIVTRDDVRAAAEGAPSPAAGTRRPAAPAREVAAAEGFGFRGREPGDTIPITGIRKRIVQKMVTSRTEIPEATTSVTVDCTATWQLAERLTEQAREQAREDGREDGATRVSAFAIVARATVLALRRFPTLNATLDEDAGEIRLLEPIHLGVAVDTDRGLMVPNIKDAHTKSTLELAIEITRLARAARDGDATPGELTGGTFTVNNYGFLGNDTGNPIINHPEAGILGVGTMKERPWVVDGELAVRRTVTLTIAFDHRISDGGEAGRFVAYVGELVEDPSRILLHT